MSQTAVQALSPEQLEGFYHVRIVIGMVTGLSITRLLNGLSGMVQHPGRISVYRPHLFWTAFLLLYVVHFWWFEFALIGTAKWQFQNYLFVIAYAALMFFLSCLLYPDNLRDYSGYRDYFQSRRKWIYGLLGLIVILDFADTALKGQSYLASLGSEYFVRQITLCLIVISAPFIRSHRFHELCAVAAIGVELWLVLSRYRYLFP